MEKMDSIYIKATNITSNHLEVNLETLLIVNVFSISDSDNVKLHILTDDEPLTPLFRIYLNKNKYHLITPENVPEIATYCIWPVIVVENTVVAGLCSVSRQIIKSSRNKNVESLLGFREACLMACSESSIWTKFCEVDMIQTVKDVFAELVDSQNYQINEVSKSKENISDCTRVVGDCNKEVSDGECKAISINIHTKTSDLVSVYDKAILDVETNEGCTQFKSSTIAISEKVDNAAEVKTTSVDVDTKVNESIGNTDTETNDLCTKINDLSFVTSDYTNVNVNNDINDLTDTIIDFSTKSLTNVNETNKKNSFKDASTKTNFINFPVDLTRFEYHMQQPVKVHNVYKIAREKNNCKDLKSSVPIKELNIPHCYSEGPYLTLADILLYPCIHFLIQVYTPKLIQKELPLTYDWYKNMSTNTHSSQLKSEVVGDVKIDLEGKTVVQEDVPQESLYSSDTNRYRPQSRIYTKQTNIEHSLDLVNQSEIGVENLSIPYGHDVDFNWKDVPIEVNPEGGSLPKSRSHRKCQQLENLTKAVLKICGDYCYTIVDFCSGSGHLGLLLGVLLPKCQIILVENKERSLIRAKQTLTNLGLTNVVLLQSNLDYFQAKFNLGVSLHACGVATDLVIQNCILNKAHFVSCPCCYGGIHDCYHLQYPRSEFYRGFISYGNYLHLAHAADQTHDSENVKTKQGYKCMDIIDTDRKLYAEKSGYVVYLGKLIPASCTPKNNLIVGIFK